MEPWKIGVIALLLAGIIGYGVVSNKTPQPLVNGGVTNTAIGGPMPSPTPSKYVGKPLPPWPTIKQWANTPSPVSLSSLKGKPLLLEVFRTSCSHCQDAAPFLVQLHARYAPRGVQFVGIQSPGDYKDPENPENNWKLVQSWLKEKGYSWPVGFDEKSAWFQGTYGNNVFYPSLFIFDANGNVAFFQSGHDARKALELGIQMENIAPGQGDAKKRATDLSHFLAPDLGLDSVGEDKLSNDIATRLGATK